MTVRLGQQLLPAAAGLSIHAIENATLVGPSRAIDLPGAVVGWDFELSISAASILRLRVADDSYRLLRSTTLDHPVRLDFGDRVPQLLRHWMLWRSRSAGMIESDGRTTTLTFWTLGAAALKSVATPRRADASRVNLGGWVAMQAAEVRHLIDLSPVVPRPGSRPPSDPSATGDSEADGSDGGAFGDRSDQVTVKGRAASKAQLAVLDEALRVASSLQASPRAVLALIEAIIVESEAQNLTYGDRDSIGVLQVRVGLHGRAVAASVSRSCTLFLQKGFTGRGGAISLARGHAGWTAGQVAQAVQGSAYPARYDQVATEARTIIEQWSGRTLSQWSAATSTDSTTQTTSESATEWRRGTADGAESAWTNLGRIADSLGRRRAVIGRRLLVARDQDLILAAPHDRLTLRDERLTARPQITQDGNHTITTVDLTCLADGWVTPQGGVVDLVDAGPASGAWIVETIRGTGGDSSLQVTLTQPTTKVATQAAAASQTTSSTTAGGAQAAIAWARKRVGIRETSNNAGPAVSPLIRAAGGTPGQAWCGWFCRGALLAAGLTPSTSMCSVQWIYDTSGGKGDVFAGRTTASRAAAGDLVILGSTGGHVGLVASVNHTEQTIAMIAGNDGSAVTARTITFGQVIAVAKVDYTRSTS
ncbi:MAG: hypothetical protein QM679_02870 [Patulibacter sp.]